MSSQNYPAKQICNFIWCDMTSLHGPKYSMNFFKTVTSLAKKAPKMGWLPDWQSFWFFLESYACRENGTFTQKGRCEKVLISYVFPYSQEISEFVTFENLM